MVRQHTNHQLDQQTQLHMIKCGRSTHMGPCNVHSHKWSIPICLPAFPLWASTTVLQTWLCKHSINTPQLLTLLPSLMMNSCTFFNSTFPLRGNSWWGFRLSYRIASWVYSELRGEAHNHRVIHEHLLPVISKSWIGTRTYSATYHGMNVGLHISWKKYLRLPRHFAGWMLILIFEGKVYCRDLSQDEF